MRHIFGSRAPTEGRVEADRSSGTSTGLAGASSGAVVHQAQQLSVAQRHGEALALLDEALHRAPKSGELMFARGRVLFDSSRYKEANEWLLKAADAGIENSSLFLQLGWTYLWTSEAAKAEL